MLQVSQFTVLRILMLKLDRGRDCYKTSLELADQKFGKTDVSMF